ncbi:MAG: T9SS type A sorting domain-containing protein, partial [Bacteroidales bacterium]|nr:T9SS type A sorting domain-containing protein [Bacteroidales bacterium]
AIFRDSLTSENKTTLATEKIYFYEKTLVIEHNNDQPFYLNIHDIKGVMVKSSFLRSGTGTKTKISLDNMPDGIYIVSLQSQSKTYTQKIIIY